MPFVVYTLARLLILAASFGLLYAAGLGGWLLAVVAVTVAFAVSYLALPSLRDEATGYLAARRERHESTEGSSREQVDAQIEDQLIDAVVKKRSSDDESQRP